MCRSQRGAEILQLLFGRQLAVNQQIARFDKIAPLGQLLDRVAAVTQNALFAVEKRNGADGRAGVHVAVVHRDQAGRGAELGDIDGRFVLGAGNDRQFQLTVVVDQFG